MNSSDGLMIDNNIEPLHFASPFWYHYVDYPFHYIPLTKLVFNKKILRFTPKNGEIQMTNVQTTRTFPITIKNVCKEQIIIHNVWTASNSIFIKQMNAITLAPSKSASITVFYCPTVTGTFHTSLFFYTNKGEIPFTLTLHANAGYKEKNTNVHFYTTNVSTPLAANIPRVVSNVRTSVLFDMNVFSVNEIDTDVGKAHLLFNASTRQGYYLTFLHFMTLTNTRTLPMFVSSSPKYLQPSEIVVVVQPVTSKNGKVEHNITLVNPTGSNFIVISAKLNKNTPNVKFFSYGPPLVCPRYMSTQIGKVVVDGSIEGKNETVLEITYEGIFPTVSQTVNVIIKYSVIYGALTPSEKVVNLIYGEEENYIFNFTNNFKKPVAIVGATISSSLVSLTNFSSCLIKPGNVSNNMKFKLNPQVNQQTTLSCLVMIETNASLLKIPVTFYTGIVTISEEKGSGHMNAITIFVAQILCETTKKFTFHITNNNPVPFVVNEFKKTPGIDIENQWMNKDGYKVAGFTVPPFQTAEFNVYISFSNINLFKPRNDVLTLIGKYCTVPITISWLPSRGSLSMNSNLPSSLTIGKSYKGSLFVNSSYSQHVKLKSVSAAFNSVSINYTTPFIRPISIGQTNTHIAQFEFELNEELLAETKLAPLLNVDSAWYQNPSRWEDMWNRALPVKLNFVLHLKGGFFTTIPIRLYVGYSAYRDVSCDFGVVSVNTPYEGQISISNTLDSKIKLCFHKAKSNSESLNFTTPTYFNIGGGTTLNIAFMFNHTKEERVYIRIPVTSNATSPFFVTVSAEVVKPSLRLFDENNISAKAIEFERSDDKQFIGKKWSKKYYLLNTGKTSVDMELQSINNETIDKYKYLGITMNCSNVKPGDACELIASVNIIHLSEEVNTFHTIFSSCGYTFETDWTVHVSHETANIIAWLKQLLKLAIITIALIPQIKIIIEKIKKLRNSFNIACSKLSHYNETIQTLSAAIKVNVSTQCVAMKEDLCGGTFVLEEAAKKQKYHSIPDDVLDILKDLAYQ